MTIKDCLNRAADESPDAVALRFKQDGEWKTTSYRELRERVWHVSEMLVKLGISEGDRVAIYRENSPEWYELYHGIVGIGAIAVPVDEQQSLGKYSIPIDGSSLGSGLYFYRLTTQNFCQTRRMMLIK